MAVHPLSWLGSFFSRAQARALSSLFPFSRFSAQFPSAGAVERAAALKRETAAPLWRPALNAALRGSPEALEQLLSAPGAALWLADPKTQQPPQTPARLRAAAAVDADVGAVEAPLGLLVAQAICAAREPEAPPEAEGETASALSAASEPATRPPDAFEAGRGAKIHVDEPGRLRAKPENGAQPQSERWGLTLAAAGFFGANGSRAGAGRRQRQVETPGGRSWRRARASASDSELVGEIFGRFDEGSAAGGDRLAAAAKPGAPAEAAEPGLAFVDFNSPAAPVPSCAASIGAVFASPMGIASALEPVLSPQTLIRLARALETPIEMAQPAASPERLDRGVVAPVFHEAAVLALWARVCAARRLGDFSSLSARFAAPALLAHESVQAASDSDKLAKPLSAGFGDDPWRVLAFCALRAPRALRRMVDLLRDADLERPAVGRAAPAGVLAWDRLALTLLLQCASGEEREKDANAAWRMALDLDLAAPLRVASQALTALLTPPSNAHAPAPWRFDMAPLLRARPRVRDLERRAGAPLRHHDERWLAVCEGHDFGDLFSSLDLAEAPQEERIGAPQQLGAPAPSPQPALAASVFAAARARHAARRL